MGRRKREESVGEIRYKCEVEQCPLYDGGFCISKLLTPSICEHRLRSLEMRVKHLRVNINRHRYGDEAAKILIEADREKEEAERKEAAQK